MKLFFRGFKNGMTQFGLLVSDTVNFLLLLVVYVIGIGITSLIAKIINKHFLELKRDVKKSSYWDEIQYNVEDKDSFYRQF